MPDLHIFGIEFENAMVRFQINAQEFFLLQNLVQKNKL